MDKEKLVFATGNGTVEVMENKVLILAESFESLDEIDKNRAQEAYDRAKEKLSEHRSETIDMARAEVSLKRALNRLKLSGN